MCCYDTYKIYHFTVGIFLLGLPFSLFTKTLSWQRPFCMLKILLETLYRLILLTHPYSVITIKNNKITKGLTVILLSVQFTRNYLFSYSTSSPRRLRSSNERLLFIVIDHFCSNDSSTRI